MNCIDGKRHELYVINCVAVLMFLVLFLLEAERLGRLCGVPLVSPVDEFSGDDDDDVDEV